MRDVEALEVTLAQQPGVVQVLPRRLGGGEVWLTVRGREGGGAIANLLRAQGIEVDASSEREVRARMPRNQ
jgi:hypothetical protein